MWQLSLILYLVFATTVYAQGPALVPMPAPLPVPVSSYAFAGSALDHNGNLFVFDTLYSYLPPVPGQPVIQRLPPTMKTRVTIITSEGNRMPPVVYDGAFQVIGTGWHAVYAVVNNYALASRSLSLSATRRLVALNAVAGVLPASLPSVDVPIRADLKLAAAADRTVPDTFSFVDIAVPLPYPVPERPELALPPPPTRFAQLVKYSGGTQFAAGSPIPLP
jgi:hypothetical protein